MSDTKEIDYKQFLFEQDRRGMIEKERIVHEALSADHPLVRNFNQRVAEGAIMYWKNKGLDENEMNERAQRLVAMKLALNNLSKMIHQAVDTESGRLFLFSKSDDQGQTQREVYIHLDDGKLYCKDQGLEAQEISVRKVRDYLQ